MPEKRKRKKDLNYSNLKHALIGLLLVWGQPAECIFDEYGRLGLSESDPLPNKQNKDGVSGLTTFMGTAPRIFAMLYIIVAIVIMRIKYVYPTIEDICTIYAQVS